MASASSYLTTTLSTDLLLYIASYGNAKSLSSLAQTSKLLLLVVMETNRRPGFLSIHGRINDLGIKAKDRLASPPNAGFIFTHTTAEPQHITQSLRQLPKGLEVIGASATNPLMSDEVEGLIQGTASLGRDRGVLSLASLPDASIHTFLPRPQLLRTVAATASGSDAALLHLLGLDPTIPYSVFVILATPDCGCVQRVLDCIQRVYPTSSIIGGIAMESVYRWSEGSLTTIHRGGLVGMAMTNSPIKSVVSRGVIPMSPALKVIDYRYNEQRDSIIVETVQVPVIDSSSSIISPYAALEHYNLLGDADLYVGLSVTQEGSFSLVEYDFVVMDDDRVCLMLSSPPPPPPPEQQQGAVLSLRFFELDAQACIDHVQGKMKQVSEEMVAKGQELLGGVLFSCNGRGPTNLLNLRRQPGVDANAFRQYFGHKHLAGFYAAGEIGPQAIYLEEKKQGTASNDEEEDTAAAAAANRSVMSCTQTGQAALQGFTAVFGLFIVPKRSQTPTGSSSPLMEKLHKEGLEVTVKEVMKQMAQ